MAARVLVLVHRMLRVGRFGFTNMDLFSYTSRSRGIATGGSLTGSLESAGSGIVQIAIFNVGSGSYRLRSELEARF